MRHLVFAASVLTSLAAASCRDRAPTDPLAGPEANACARPSGTWILGAHDGLFANRVLILSVDSGPARQLAELPSLDANGVLGTSLDSSSIVSYIGCSSLGFFATLASTGAQIALHADVTGDTARGFVATDLAVVQGDASTVFGLRVDPGLLLPPDSAGPTDTAVDSTPVLVLRIDDAFATDRSFLPRVAQRGLVAELAIPTMLVGRPGFLTWDEVVGWSRSGFGIAAHSRRHSPATNADIGFMAEVIGSFADLRSHGLGTRVFVQPGSWKDSIYFDTPGKLANWRGALVRNLAKVFEAYAASPVTPSGMEGAVPFGVSHFTVSGPVTLSWVLTQLRHIYVRGSFSVLMLHSINVQPPDTLDWLLDSIATAVRTGRLRLANSSEGFLDPVRR